MLPLSNQLTTDLVRGRQIELIRLATGVGSRRPRSRLGSRVALASLGQRLARPVGGPGPDVHPLALGSEKGKHLHRI